MVRRFLPLLLLILALTLDISVLPFLTRGALLPALTPTTVVALALLLGRTRGALYGMIAGILTDVLISTPFGMFSIVLSLCGYLSGIAGRRFQRYALTPVVTPLLCLFAYEAAQAAYMYLAGAALSGKQMLLALARVVIGVGLTQLLYLLFNKLLKPKWSRYTAR